MTIAKILFTRFALQSLRVCKSDLRRCEVHAQGGVAVGQNWKFREPVPLSLCEVYSVRGRPGRAHRRK